MVGQTVIMSCDSQHCDGTASSSLGVIVSQRVIAALHNLAPFIFKNAHLHFQCQ